MNDAHNFNSDTTASAPQGVKEVDIDAIRENRNQPRTHFDEQALAELADSIREHGLIQPLIVTIYHSGGYELIAGERRWRAARQAGLRRVPVLVKDATPQQLLELALVENIQRADLNPLEEGRAYQTLKDEFGLKDDEIAQRVGKSRVAIVNARRLIKLIPAVQQALIAGTISAGHGRALLRLELPEHQAAALALIQRNELNVRESERLADLLQTSRLSHRGKQILLSGAVDIEHAQTVLELEDKAQQDAVLEAAVTHNLGVRETERLVKNLASGMPYKSAIGRIVGPAEAAPLGGAPARGAAHPGGDAGDTFSATRLQSPSPEDDATRRLFEEILATPVQIVRSHNIIRLTITLYNDEQLQALYDLMAGKPEDTKCKI